jgi:hypothetical protein
VKSNEPPHCTDILLSISFLSNQQT